VPQVAIAWERSWREFWAEAEALVLEHQAEVRVIQGRLEPHDPNVDALESLHRSHWLHIVGARVNGSLAGYMTWMLEPNLESKGSRIIRQGNLFVRPQWAGLQLAFRMMRFSMNEFSSILAPVRVIARHPEVGRARAMSVVYRRFGLVESAHEWTKFLEPEAVRHA
jgi:hypothetical protein